MASSIDVQFGLNASDFIAGVASIESGMKTSTAMVNRQIQTLAKQYQSLKGNSSEYERYVAAARGADDAQRSQINSLLEGIEAEKRHKQAMKESAEQADKLNGKYQNIASTLKTWAAGYLSISGAQKAIESMDAYDQVQNKLRRVTDGEAELQAATTQTKQIALESRTSWDSVAAIYQKVGINADKLGLSQEQVGATAETISKAMKVSGASAESTSAALYQLGQAFDKGVLNGDEFASISENTGYVLDALAKQLGVTRGELKDMSSAGKLTSDIMINAFTGMADSVDADFAKVKVSASDAMQNLKTMSIDYIGSINKTYDITGKFVSVVNLLANNLDAVAAVMMGTFAAAAVHAGKAVYGAAKAIGDKITQIKLDRQATIASTAETLRNAQAEQVKAAAQLRSARAAAQAAAGTSGQTAAEAALAVARAKHAATLVAETAATNAASVATNRLTLAKTLLSAAMGGPMGLIVAGASVAAMYYAFSDASAAATTAMDEQIGTVTELTQRMKELNEEEKFRLKIKVQAKADDVNKQLSDFEGKIKNLDIGQFIIGGTESLRNSFSSAQAQEVGKSFDKIKSGASSVADELQRLEKAGGFTKSQIIELNEVFEKGWDAPKKEAKDLEQQLNALNGKEVIVDVKYQSSVDGKDLDLTSNQQLVYEGITGASKEAEKLAQEFGKTSEQLKIAQMEENYASLAKAGATRNTLASARAEIDKTKQNYASIESMKQVDEQNKKATQLAEQNAKFVTDEITKRETLIAQLGKSKEEIAGLELAAKGATAAQIKQIKAMDSVISEYEKQKGVMKSLEDLDKQIARLGKSETEVKLMDLKDAGATEEQLSLAKMQLGAIEEFKLSTQAQKNSAASFDKSVKLNNTMAEKFANGVDGFVGGVDKLKEGDKSKKSPLALDNPQISLIKGKGWYNDHVDQDPTGRKFTSKGSQQVMSDMLKKMKDGLDKTGEALGTLYLASPDGQSFVKMLTDPKNGKIIKDWAKVAMGEYVRDGAMSNS